MLLGDRSQHSVEFSHLGDSRTRRVKTRRFNRRGCEVARLREALTVKPSPWLHVEGRSYTRIARSGIARFERKSWRF
jgi:hypothetical protein